MNREVPRGRADPKQRRSSVHFHYDSEEEPSPLPPPDSPSPALTVKTAYIANNNMETLSNFDQPIFHPLRADYRRKQPLDQHQREEQEQFWSFLEKFGKEGDSEVDFEEEATVFYGTGTSTDYRTSKSKLKNSKSKPRLGGADSLSFGHPRISEAEEDRSPQYVQMKPRVDYAVAATQTVNFPSIKRRQQQRPNRPVAEHSSMLLDNTQLGTSCSKNLTFREFREAEEEDDRRYPIRATRECGRLKFWQCERIDYAKGGVWLQKEQNC